MLQGGATSHTYAAGSSQVFSVKAAAVGPLCSITVRSVAADGSAGQWVALLCFCCCQPSAVLPDCDGGLHVVAEGPGEYLEPKITSHPSN